MVTPDLMNWLKDPRVERRLEAVRHFSAAPEFPAELFIAALGDEDWRVRKEAVGQFLRLPEAAGRAPFLIDLLSHPDNAGLRNAAIEILISLGATIVPVLTEHLAVVAADVRKFLIDILGEIGHPACAPALLPYLRDADDNVRYAVVETSGKLKAKEAVPGLLALLDTADTGLRFTIFEALAEIGVGVPVARLIPYSEDRLLRKAVFSCLGRLGDVEAVRFLVAGFSDPLRTTRETALQAVGELIRDLPATVQLPQVCDEVSDFTGMVDKYLGSDDPVLRRASCYALVLKPEPDLLRKALLLLEREELRNDVIAAFKRIPEETLATLLEGVSGADELKIYLVFLLGELNNPAVIPLASTGLGAESSELRYVSALTLGKVAATDAIEQLGDCFLDPVAEVRGAASDSLKKLGAKAPDPVAATLIPYLESDDVDLRLLAVRTLGSLPLEKIEDTLLLSLKDVAAEVRCEAIRSLTGGVSPRLLSGLSLALTDEERGVRRLAAEALAAFPPGQVLPILAHVADDPDPWVRLSALKALTDGQLPGVEALVNKALADKVPPVVIAALETMARLFPGRSEDYLRQALDHADPDVVSTAVGLLLTPENAGELLSHGSKLVRLVVAGKLENQPEAGWVKLFERCLESENDPEVRAAMAAALRRGRAGG